MKVAIIMGSTSDLDIMSQAINVLEGFGVEVVKRVISAHRTPDLMCEFAKSAKSEGIGVIIAGAGGAAHVAGVVAGMTTVPVIGVPGFTSVHCSDAGRNPCSHNGYQRSEECRTFRCPDPCTYR